jgi:serine protease
MAPGEYLITLTIIDDFNVSQEVSLNTVVANANQTPFRVDVDANRALITTDKLVTFKAQMLANEEVSINNYIWKISGNIPATSTETDEYSYQFENVGEYTLEVEAFASDGFRAKSSSTITVTDSNNTQSISVDLKLRNGVYMDTDTNLQEAAYIENNTFLTPQVIPSTANVVGFVTSTPTGIPGDVFESFDDIFDVYSTELKAGQQVFLSRDQEEDTEADLDLAIYNTDFELVDFSVSSSNTEVVSASENGTYYIAVQAFSGKSTYELNTNYRGAQSSSASIKMDFVLGDIIVSSPIKSKKSTQNSARERTKALSVMGIESSDNSEPMFIQLLKSPTAITLSQSKSRVISSKIGSSSFSALKGSTMTATQAAKLRTLMDIKAIKAKGLYKHVEPNYIQKKSTITNDTWNDLTWHYNNIRLSQAWEITTGNADNPIVVAVVDTGVLSDHPDLAPNLVAGYDFISDPLNANDGDGIDSNPYDAGDSVSSENSSYHGSHVGSTIAAATNNEVGIAGVGYNVQHMPIRVLGKNGGSIYDIYNGVLYAAGLPNSSGTIPDKPADVINMSLGGYNSSQAIQDIINKVTSQGVIIIAAAGNENTSLLSFPASYENVISVSATDFNNVKAPYSNFGSFIDVAAPGGNKSEDINNDGHSDGVLGAYKDDNNNQLTYDFYEGTSMAAPHVAGVAALMKSVRPQLTQSEFELLLRAGFLTLDTGDLGRDDLYGYGLIDAEKAVIAARDFDDLKFEDSIVEISTDRVALSFSQSTGQFSVNISGFTALSITDITSTGNFFTVNDIVVREDGSGLFEVRLNNDVATGNYEGSITLTDSNSETYTVSVTASVEENTVEQKGYVFALLLDAFTNEVAGELSGEFNADGSLILSSSEAPVGEYYILVGSDIDNDFFICDGGEVCGGYPTLNDMAPIIINEEPVEGLSILIDAETILSGTNSASFLGKPKGSFFKRK